MKPEHTLLDHGYVRLVEHWGGGDSGQPEAGIIEAARQSTQRTFEGWGTAEKPGDEKLLRYLWEHKHATPFEMAGAIFEIQAPIFVFREWHRHRTQSYNEMSARYAPIPNLNYIPTVERLLMGGGLTRQAGTIKGAEPLTRQAAEFFQAHLAEHYGRAEAEYRYALQKGVPKELARLVIPVGRYSRMRASANLRNWCAFMTLRLADDAQWEIRSYAGAVHDILSELFPRTIALFDERLR